jgi:regulator of protease activity HflC (stomatin/prohibitin superfamily)
MNDEDLEDLLGAYALDAVNEDERKQIDAYLVRSPQARAEVQRHHEVAAAIAASPGEAPAPLWLRIESLLDDRSPSEATLAMPELLPSKGTSSAWSPAVGPRPQSLQSPETTEPRTQNPSPRSTQQPKEGGRWFGLRPQRGGVVALPSHGGLLGKLGMAFAAVAIVSLGVGVVRLNSSNRLLRQEASAAKRMGAQRTQEAKAEAKRADDLAAKLVAAAKTDARLETLLASPTTKTVTLTSASGATLAKVVVGADGKGYLLGGELPVLPKGHTYQLWGVHNPTGSGATKATSVLSLGVFGQHPESVAFAADSSDPWQTFALTDEQSPGVVTSKQPAIAAGNVEAA